MAKTTKPDLPVHVTISASNTYHFLLKYAEHVKLGYVIDGQRNHWIAHNACIADLVLETTTETKQ
jgi:hypothetical protein